jgi:4-aminobutyrate aminotransferase-like enzyme
LRRDFLEYFVARHLARCARAGADTLRVALATDTLTPSCIALLTELVADAPETRSTIQAIATGPYVPEASENAIKIAAALGVGAAGQ